MINQLYSRQYGGLAPTGGGAGIAAQASGSAAVGASIGGLDARYSGIFVLILLALGIIGYHGLKGG